MLNNIWGRLGLKQAQAFQPVILVTGCGSGLGLALADLLYAEEKYRVVITARVPSLGMLRERFTQSDRFWIRTLDVASHNDREALLREIEANWGGVNILVNNAGISYRAVLEHMSDHDEWLQMSTNYLGPVALIRGVLPYMRKLGRGKIINISSVSGMMAMPTMASYSASKYALEGVSEALWYEVKPLGIDVTLVQPGFIRSESHKSVRYTELSRPDLCIDRAYCDYYRHMTPFIERFMRKSLSTPQCIAKKVLKVIRTQKPPLWVPATIDAWFFYYLRRWIPRRVFLSILFRGLPRAAEWGKPYTNDRFYRQKRRAA